MMHKILHLVIVISLLFQGCAGFAAGMKEREGITRVGYSIQVGAFAEVKNAERLTAKLQAKGIDAFYFKKDNGVYAVRFGDHPSREAARKGAQKLVAEKIIGAYFIASPQDAYLTKPKGPELHKGGEPPAKPKAGPDMGGIAARTAERFVGIPYQWGGNNVVEGMDCSGFVRAVFNLCGVNIPRTSREQFRVGESIARDDLADGDLVFFGASSDQINHVGIYVGSGRFVHAPRRGDDIKVSSLDEAYFTKKFVGAKRYF
ncbi:MAG: NlpC/P60 family protein [Geobacteraceae bacterium]|nr:NlpC/P60 family protein [Geobacteraceae bacterium]